MEVCSCNVTVYSILKRYFVVLHRAFRHVTQLSSLKHSSFKISLRNECAIYVVKQNAKAASNIILKS